MSTAAESVAVTAAAQAADEPALITEIIAFPIIDPAAFGLPPRL